MFRTALEADATIATFVVKEYFVEEALSPNRHTSSSLVSVAQVGSSSLGYLDVLSARPDGLCERILGMSGESGQFFSIAEVQRRYPCCPRRQVYSQTYVEVLCRGDR